MVFRNHKVEIVFGMGVVCGWVWSVDGWWHWCWVGLGVGLGLVGFVGFLPLPDLLPVGAGSVSREPIPQVDFYNADITMGISTLEPKTSPGCKLND